MPHVGSYMPGMFCWSECASSNQTAAKEFYTRVFDWNASDSPYGDGQLYTMLLKGELSAAGLLSLHPDEVAAGSRSHWNVYISVSSVDESAAKAVELGATLLAPPFDVPGVGRMAIVKDPCDAVFCLWQRGNHFGAAVVDEGNAFCWYELAVKDTAKATAFYSSLFGWTAIESPGYTEWALGSLRIGGMMEIPDVPPNWMPYVMVDDCAAAAARLQDAGGTLLLGPGAAGDKGFFCIILDPQGATLGLFQRNAA